MFVFSFYFFNIEKKFERTIIRFPNIGFPVCGQTQECCWPVLRVGVLVVRYKQPQMLILPCDLFIDFHLGFESWLG